MGVDVDVHDWGGGVMVVEDSTRLPCADASFDTVSFVACLNHIPRRQAALVEARRVVRTGGVLIITMIDPVPGGIGHAVWWYSEDKHRGGMVERKVGGLWNVDIVRMARAAGFEPDRHQRFVYGMSGLHVMRAVERTA